MISLQDSLMIKSLWRKQNQNLDSTSNVGLVDVLSMPSSYRLHFRHIATGKYVAIKFVKVPQPRATMTIEDIRLLKKAKFLRQEIETHRQLLCPYIVAFYGFATINSEVLICMELMGMSLEDLNEFIHRSDHNKSDIAVFPEKLLVVIGKSILNGLRSRFLENGHATTSDAGSIAYMPPERIPGHPNPSVVYDIRSDTWSLGVTLAELVCGKYPIVDEDGNIPQGDISILMRCIRIVKGNEICERCFENKYPEYIKGFAELCLEELSKRPKFDQLVQTKFYECFNELLEETNAYVATFVCQIMDFEENKHTTTSSSSTLINL
uniref:mitogen-activated protein kinase kinase n=1 Tax=Acrobeloides nanus TaxID=290746 RepID=A0A914C0F2_9BILA